MTLFLTTGRKQPKRGKSYGFYVLRENFWDKKTKSQKQRYVAYIGTKPKLTLEKAKVICKAKSLKLEDLKAVKGLTIIS